MLTYWETLIATRSNIAVNDSYAKLWGRKLSNAYTVATYTGTLPATLRTVAGHLESYKIYGNTVQVGTPTPENPIMPSRCGEIETTGIHAGQYKLPTLSNSTVTNIYLGEVETTRRIRKLVLTGEENITLYTISTGNLFRIELPVNRILGQFLGNGICTHYRPVSKLIDRIDGTISGGNTEAVQGVVDIVDNYATIADFKSYLAQQYAAGTPVTVWYILAEPETSIVNEPLMKIGDYSDTIDSAQSSVQIPTAAGSTTISWAGEGLAPSEVEFVYKVKR